MGVIQHASRPSPRVSKEPYLRRGLCMIPLPGLDDLWPVLLEQPRRTMCRPDDRYVSRPVRVGALVNYHHQLPLVRQRLRRMCVLHCPPAALPARWGTKPSRLRVGKQYLSVFRRPQHVHSQPLPGSGGECAAMRRPARSRVVWPSVRLARLPVHVLMRQP